MLDGRVLASTILREVAARVLGALVVVTALGAGAWIAPRVTRWLWTVAAAATAAGSVACVVHAARLARLALDVY